MGRKTNQRHFRRKEYRDVGAWCRQNIDMELIEDSEPSVENPILQADEAQRVLEKTEASNPYLAASQLPIIFQNDAVNPVATLDDMCRLAEFVKHRYVENARAIQLYNSRLMDIQHEIEMLPPKSAPKGYSVYKEQRDILIARRVAKDENAVMEPLKELIDKNPGAFSAMIEVLRQTQRINKNRVDRIYHYRAPEMIGKKVIDYEWDS